MQDNDFRPNGFDVQLDESGGFLRLVFYDDDEKNVQIVIPVSNGPQLLAVLTAKIGHGSLRPIRPDELAIGRAAHPMGVNVRTHHSGERLLTILLQTADGGRSLPISLSETEARQLANDLIDKGLESE